MEIRTDSDSPRRLWRPGRERYDPQGVDDPDYSGLRFAAARGNFYHSLSNLTFDVE
jgi:general stress protein 26